MLARGSEQIQTETAVTAPKQGPRRAAIAMFGLLLASYVINAMDRQLFPLLVPEVRRQYNFSLSDVGLLSTVFTLGMALAGLPTGYMLSRLSRKTVLQAGIALFSACTILTVMAYGFSDMLIYRAVTVVGEAMQLTAVSVVGGSVSYGYLGMYPAFLREGLRYSPTTTGTVMSLYGLGALCSIGGGWLGDRFSPRLVLGLAFLVAAILGFLMFNGSGGVLPQVILSFGWGVVVSWIICVSLGGYHVKSLRRALASRASGIFVTSLYGSASVAGYVMGWIATQGGWAAAGTIQLSVLSLVAATLALALRPDPMSA